MSGGNDMTVRIFSVKSIPQKNARAIEKDAKYLFSLAESLTLI